MKGKRLDARRVYSALVFLPLFYLVVRYGPPAGFFMLVLSATVLALIEFYRLHFPTGTGLLDISLGVGCTGLLLLSMYWPHIPALQAVVTTCIVMMLTWRLLTQEPSRERVTDISIVLLGILYIGFLLGHLLLTRGLPDGERLILFLVFVTWAGDTGAYYAGTAFGRRKLAPRISPNKTVEGLIGGIALSVVAAFIAQHWFIPSFNAADSLGLGLLLPLTGLLGDLAESGLKRGAGVKDSGGLIPGHGGVLDRLDSLLFAGPALYYYVTLVKG